MHAEVRSAGFGGDHSFFFQAEDGIRDRTVTGVQTCALPICAISSEPPDDTSAEPRMSPNSSEIGRASCRERVEISVGAVSFKKNSANNRRLPAVAATHTSRRV